MYHLHAHHLTGVRRRPPVRSVFAAMYSSLRMIGSKLAHIQADSASERPDLEKDGQARRRRRGGRKQTIKRRVIRLVLVPSVVAMVLWLMASGYLVFQGFYNRAVADSVRQVSIPAVSALASIQQERRLSIAYLAQPASDLATLVEQRKQTDRGVAELRTAAESALALAPDSIVAKWTTLTEHLDKLPGTRSIIDSKSVNSQHAYGFYNELLDAATSLFDTQARVVPDVAATQGGIAATEVFRASDLMSRAGSTIDGAFAASTLSQPDHLEFARLVGTYHSSLVNLTPNLQPAVRQRLSSIAASDSWKELVAAENAIIASGAWRTGVPRGLPADKARWETLTREVSDQLIGLTILQADVVSAEALRTGNNQLITASLGSLIALLIAVAAIVWAVRQSRVLVDQALSVRLSQLGKDAAAVVDQRLPAIMERLRRREQVDLSVELQAAQNYGSDEIGQVADVINRSLQAAAGAAVNEAKARAAGTAMLMGVARRPQRPLQQGLKVVEELQSVVGDEKMLTQLFDINHQLTQTRRFLENLVILSGGQIGRRFHKPVPLRRVMLAAFAEARHYQRITLRHSTDVAIVGQAVAGTVHLLAELLDNALAFSSPGTTVWVTCNEVRHGVAVEIEDAGVGMNPEAVERANLLLATSPTPDVTELKGGAQVGLHVVAELAKREGVQVSLRRSAYGGLLAVVLLPHRMLVTEFVDTPVSGMDADLPAPATAASSFPQADSRQQELQLAAAWSLPTPAPAPAPAATPVSLPADSGRIRQPEPAGQMFNSFPPASSAGAHRQPMPPVAAGAGSSSPDSAAKDRPPLPKRLPQQHLVAELREEETANTGTAQGQAAPPRSPEESRNRFARYQRGWTDGRIAGHNETVTGADQGGKA
jgi:signal transduction histidine kinase